MDPWDVLTDKAIIGTARQVCGTASLNPLYSNPAITLREGALYVAGQNPGGDPRVYGSQDRHEPLDHPRRPAHRKDWCKLLDEDDRDTTYRESLRFLVSKALPGGLEGLRDAFCTNALFMRGNVNALSAADKRALWHVCRPWHQQWLGIVKPKVILCLGNDGGASAYAWFKSMLDGVADQPETPTYTNYRLKVCEGEFEGRPVVLIGTPNPSRWSSSSPKSANAVANVAAIVRERLGRSQRTTSRTIAEG